MMELAAKVLLPDGVSISTTDFSSHCYTDPGCTLLKRLKTKKKKEASAMVGERSSNSTTKLKYIISIYSFTDKLHSLMNTAIVY